MARTKKAKKTNRDHYGLPIYESPDGHEYAVGTQAEAHEAAKQNAKESLWAFRASYIIGFLPIDGRAAEVAEKGIETMQEKLSEDAQPIIELLLGDKLDRFLDRAVRDDGAGHFLNGYDGEEYDSDDIDGLPKGKLAFRVD